MKKNRLVMVNLLFAIMIFAVLLLSSFSLNNPPNKLALHQSNGTIRLATGQFDVTSVDELDDIYSVLQSVKNTYGIKNVNEEFSYDKTLSAPFGFVHKLSQIFDGYNVFGRSVSVSTDQNGKVLQISGNYLKNIKPNNSVRLSFDAAQSALQLNFLDITIFFATIEIYTINTEPVFVYCFSTSLNGGAKIFLDAESGDIVEIVSTVSNETIPTQPYQTTQVDYFGNTVDVTIEKTVEAGANGHTFYLADCLRNIYILDNQNSTDFVGEYYENSTGIFDKMAITAFLNFVKTFDFFADEANIGVSLRGIDNSVNFVHDDAEDADEMIVYAYLHYGQEYQNAAYMSEFTEDNKKQAVFIFGEGNSNEFFDFVTSLDVVGHEYQHAITDNAAGLIYLNASGAISEAISDIFGALVEGHDLTDDDFWLVGEDIVNKKYQYAMRDMKNPLALNYPNYYKGNYFHSFCYMPHDHYNSTCDNGGVHQNSTIVSHAAYEMYRLLPQAFTKQLMGKLWYSTLLLLPQDADFCDLRVLMRRAAVMLGCSDKILNTIGLAFDNAGIFGSDGEHTITFQKGDAVGDVPQAITRLYGEEFVIPQCNLTKEGYKLFGWSEDGTSNSTFYVIGEAYKMTGRDLTLLPVFQAAVWNNVELTTWSGQGSFDPPYLIQSEADLATLAYYINNWQTVVCPQKLNYCYFKQTRDLDLQNINWMPIGTQRYINNLNALLASYDGGGHKIYNLKIDGKFLDTQALGLFGIIDFSVSNLGIESGSIFGNAKYVGSIGGNLYGTIENCYNRAEVTNTNIEVGILEHNITGGLAGVASNVKNSFNYANVTGNALVAGIVAVVDENVSNCTNSGNIVGGFSAGGIVASHMTQFGAGIKIEDESIFSINAATVGNCYNTGSITGLNAGGIGGKTSDIYYANCVNTGKISGSSAESSVGGIVGHSSYKKDWWLLFGYSRSEGTMILGCKNVGVVDTSTARFSGGIAGQLFDENNVGYVRYEKNTFQAQNGLLDIGNYNLFNQYMTENFFGQPAKSSTDDIFEGDFDFDNVEFFNNADNWAITSWSTDFSIGHSLDVLDSNKLPIAVLPLYWTDFRVEAFAGGMGTSSAPYKIETAEQLALLAWAVNFNDGKLSNALSIESSCFVVMNDLDLSGKIWVPIGYTFCDWLSGGGSISGMSFRFGGVFNGNGKVIKNLYARDYTWLEDSYSNGFEQSTVSTKTSSAALFGAVGGNSMATVKNVILENCNIAGGTAAGIVADLDSGTVENCEVFFGRICGTQSAGGVVGHIKGDYYATKIQNCLNSASVFGSSAVGGIVGETYYADYTGVRSSYYTIANCINLGELTNFGSNLPNNPTVGGIVGRANCGIFDISNCINMGKISNFDYFAIAGGIVGYGFKANLKIKNCIQFCDFECRQTEFSVAGAIAGVPLPSTGNPFDCSFTISNCFFNVNKKAVAEVIFGQENPTVTLQDTVFSNLPTDFEFSNIEYFGMYFKNLTEDVSNWMFARLNNDFSTYFLETVVDEPPQSNEILMIATVLGVVAVGCVVAVCLKIRKNRKK